LDSSFGRAFYKSQLAANQNLPFKGKILISVKSQDKRAIVFVAKRLSDMNFELIATKGTYKALSSNNIKVKIALSGDEKLIKKVEKVLEIKIKKIDVDAKFFIVDRREILFCLQYLSMCQQDQAKCYGAFVHKYLIPNQ